MCPLKDTRCTNVTIPWCIFTFLCYQHVSAWLPNPDFHDGVRVKYNEVRREFSKLFLNRNIGTNDGIVDVSEYLEFFKECLVHFINYRNMDLSMVNTNVPFVLSRYGVVKIEYEVSRKTSRTWLTSTIREFQYRPYPLISTFLNNSSKQIKHCGDIYTDFSHCNDIPQVDRSNFTKPWFCEAQIYVYPPTPKEDFTFYQWTTLQIDIQQFVIPASFKRFWIHNLNTSLNLNEVYFHPDKNQHMISLLITRPQIDILLLPRAKYISSWEILALIDTWSKSITINPEMVFGADITFASSSRELVLRDDGSATLSWLCRYCTDCNYMGLEDLGKMQNYQQLLNHFYRQNLANIGRIFWNIMMGTALYEHFIRLTSSERTTEYQQYLRLSHDYNGAVDGELLQDFRFNVEAMLFKTAMKNLSFYSTGHGTANRPSEILNVLKNKGVVQALLYLFAGSSRRRYKCGHERFGQDSFILILKGGARENSHLRFHEVELKFVSCGKPTEVTGLGPAVVVLAGIFDAATWSSIVVAQLVVVVLASKFNMLECLILSNQRHKEMRNNLNSVIGNWVTSVKILLEQGDPMTVYSNSGHSSIRLMFGAYLLVAIVISSAFKNDNVTEVTLQRQPIPFDNLPALYKKPFQIFTRGAYTYVDNIQAAAQKEPLMNILQLLTRSRDNVSRTHLFSNYLSSELYMYAVSYDTFKMKVSAEYDDSRFPESIREILNKSSLHPQWNRMMFDGSVTDYDVLVDCNYTALLLPDVEASLLYFRLKNESKSAFLGDNLGHRLHYNVVFSRWANIHVVRRLKSLEIGGLWDWWTYQLVNVMTNVKRRQFRNREDDIQMKLVGNILIVFALYGIGILIGSLGFWAENRVVCYAMVGTLFNRVFVSQEILAFKSILHRVYLFYTKKVH